VSRAKTAEPIAMPFGSWARLGPEDHVLDGDPDPPANGQFRGEGAAYYNVFIGTFCRELCKNG